MTILNQVTFNADGNCSFTFRKEREEQFSDQVIAEGVAINEAMFSATGQSDGPLILGTVLTAISNTSADPISGTFNNLPDGAIVNVNSGTGAFLAPSKGIKKPATLTIQGALTLNDDSTYLYKLDTKRAKADEVIANGVGIDSGAKFSLRPSGNNALSTGQVFTVISNTSANPIVGTFHNLADDAVVTVNGSNLQASYTGGDGNDLTLTVVP